MTAQSDTRYTQATAVQKCRARATLRRTVEALVRGAGLEIRETASHLTVSNPRHPDKGRLYITYANGDVSCKRVTWSYLGPLRGYDGNDPDREPAVDAARIIATLGEDRDPREGL